MKAVIGVAALGADYEIPFSLLLENFQSLVARGAYVGCYKPMGNVRKAFLREAGRVLKRVPSFMSTIDKTVLNRYLQKQVNFATL